MPFTKLYKTFFLILVLTNTLYGQTGGRGTYSFLNLPISARVASLGGTAMGIYDDDINVAIFNPAALSSKMNNQLALSYVNYFAGINYGYTAYAKNTEKYGTFLTGIQYVSYGKFTRAEENGEITGNFKAGEYALNLGWAYQIDSSFRVGAMLKPIYSNMADVYSLGISTDISAAYFNKEKEFAATLLLRNIGTTLKSYSKSNRENLPIEIQAGVSKRLKHAPFRLLLNFTNLQTFDLTYTDTTLATINPLTGEKEDNSPSFLNKSMRHVVAGVEFIPSENFHVRLGYNVQRGSELGVESKLSLAGFSWGLGFRVKKFHLSYGMASYHIAGASHHITIATNLNAFK